MNRCTLTWLGQAGFHIETAALRMLIDPWASPHPGRLIPPPPETLCENIDWVLVTHEHLDHLDLEFLRSLEARNPNLQVMFPAPIAAQVGSIFAVPIAPGDVVDLGDESVEVVPAWHALHSADGYTNGNGRFVGYILRGPGPTVYHAGDTLVTEELLQLLREKEIDVALLPINGRDYFREEQDITGNMDAREAISFARRIGAQCVVPYHWDGFEGNTVHPGTAADAAVGEGPHVLVLARFAAFSLARAGAAPDGRKGT
jgi:L-ascorbate 6-phosphate lactonase